MSIQAKEGSNNLYEMGQSGNRNWKKDEGETPQYHPARAAGWGGDAMPARIATQRRFFKLRRGHLAESKLSELSIND
jgi:hypothetical protein